MASLPTVFEIAGKYLTLYEGFYKEVDATFKGIISASDAAGFLKKSNLSNAHLGVIWEIADQNKKGYLDKVGFFAALKLIACAQQGVEPAVSNLMLDIPPPSIAGQADSPSVPMFGSHNREISGEWAIKAAERAKYDDIFDTLGPTNGKLNGEQVKPVLLNSGLPNELLGKIWELSDIDKDGFLDREEMSVALHLVYRALENDSIPVALPTGLIPPSKRGRLSRRSSTLTGAVQVLPQHPYQMSHKSRASSVTSMESVGLVGGPQSPNATSRSLSGTRTPAPPVVRPPAPWIVDKTKFEGFFNEADRDRDGLVSGNDVKQIFLQSGLAQMYLAHIWNLCDINSTGTLNLEQFSLAMYLIDQKKRFNAEPPASLPPDLIPSSFRPSPAGMTDMATNTSLEAGFGQSKSSGYTDIDHISKEIFDLQKEKREFEHQIIQLDADMTIKQSEIRNLEVELSTLTVSQLEQQKGEAQKRLDDLENQKSNLLNIFNEAKRKIEEEQMEAKTFRVEVENNVVSMKNNEDSLNDKRVELQKLRDEEGRLETTLAMQRGNLRDITKRDSTMEDNIGRVSFTMKRSSSSTIPPTYNQNHLQNSSDMQPDVIESDINILDDQLAEIIFQFVPMCQWSSCLEYVSKQFQRSVQLAYGRIKFVNVKKLFSLKRSMKNWNLGSEKLLFSKDGSTVRLNNVLKKLLSVCPNLTGIAGFEYVAGSMNAYSTWNILKKFHRLQSLSLEGVHIELRFSSFADFVASCKSLKNLTTSCCYFKSRGTLDVGSLSSVVFKNLLSKKPTFLENFSEKLTALTIDGLCNSFKTISDAEKAMKMCVNLESFSVDIYERDLQVLFNILPNLRKLTTLRISNAFENRSWFTLNENFCVQLDSIKSQLKIVELRHMVLSNEVQQFLLTKCVRLESLKFFGVGSLSSNALENLTSLPETLKELAFMDFPVQILPLLLPNLVQLSNFVDLTVRGHLLSKEWENICCLVHLKNLRVYGGFIDDSLFEKWDKKNDKMFEKLVALEIPYCKRVSDVGGCLLAKKAINLQILDLSYSKITDKTISIVAHAAKRLKTANFAYCELLFDEKDILYFIEKAVALKKLIIDVKLAKKVAQRKDFLPFVEYVEIEPPIEYL